MKNLRKRSGRERGLASSNAQKCCGFALIGTRQKLGHGSLLSASPKEVACFAAPVETRSHWRGPGHGTAGGYRRWLLETGRQAEKSRAPARFGASRYRWQMCMRK